MSGAAGERDPYVRLSHREVYRNRWIGVEAHAITHPGGAEGEHVLIRSAPSVGAVVVDGDEVVLTRQPRFAARAEVIEIVKGGRDPRETAEDAARRETEEELGLRAGRLAPLGLAWELPSLMQEPIVLFLAEDVAPGRAHPEETEAISVVRMPLVAAFEGALRGDFADAVTTTALARAAAHLGYRLTRGEARA